jgi:hypothetical protein
MKILDDSSFSEYVNMSYFQAVQQNCLNTQRHATLKFVLLLYQTQISPSAQYCLADYQSNFAHTLTECRVSN